MGSNWKPTRLGGRWQGIQELLDAGEVEVLCAEYQMLLRTDYRADFDVAMGGRNLARICGHSRGEDTGTRLHEDS